MNGEQYRKLLQDLNLNKALNSQLHSGFKPEMYQAAPKHEPSYLPGSNDLKFRPPPLTEDYSNLGKVGGQKAKDGSRKFWANLTPAQRKIEIEKRRKNAKNWRTKFAGTGALHTRHFVGKYITKQPKQKP
jgi:hypothetical protein